MDAKDALYFTHASTGYYFQKMHFTNFFKSSTKRKNFGRSFNSKLQTKGTKLCLMKAHSAKARGAAHETAGIGVPAGIANAVSTVQGRHNQEIAVCFSYCKITGCPT